MGKTASGAVWLNSERFSPYDYWQFWRNTEDGDVSRFLKLFTTLPMKEIEKLEVLEGAEINEAKKILATQATQLLHGAEAANAAAQTARETFELDNSAVSLPTIDISLKDLSNGIPVFILLTRSGLTQSNSDSRRLIKGGGCRINDNSINDEMTMIGTEKLDENGFIKISAGKKRHILIRPV